jgi:hypothetical protein
LREQRRRGARSSLIDRCILCKYRLLNGNLYVESRYEDIRKLLRTCKGKLRDLREFFGPISDIWTAYREAACPARTRCGWG